MAQLLISVKNAEEAALALAAGVDIIDLKDPNVGALGALDLAMTRKIVALVNGKTLLSATVGEQHISVAALLADIQLCAQAGVDIVKIAVSDLFQHADFYDEIEKMTKNGLKIVAVFFANEKMDVALLQRLKNAGFYGAMLDTKNKHKNLLQVQQTADLHLFVQQCHKNELISGLAGSLKIQDVDVLLALNPTYIGFRGGVCENSQRKTHLQAAKLQELVRMLLNGNKNTIKAQLILGLALHS
jgi:(5-formylfuran-3-yl)methyl phosphate synthase